MVVWARGPARLDEVAHRAAAVVGTRAATAYGEQVAGELAAGLAQRDVAVVSGGAYLAAPILWAFGADGLKEEIDVALKDARLEIARLDEGSAALAELSVTFKEKMGLLAGVSKAVSLAGTILFLVPGVGTQLTMVAGSIYAIVLAGVVLVGRDYTDSGPFKQVTGIRDITRDLVK